MLHSLRLLLRPRLRRLRAFTAITGIVVIAPLWLALPGIATKMSRALAQLAWRMLLGGLRVRMTMVGNPVKNAPVLFVANHVSWLDIAVLGHILDAGFVAKSEIARWPVLGRLATRYGCAFIARERRGKAHQQAASLGDVLRTQRRLILFPEGTTGPGNCVLPFRSSLFAAVEGQADCVVQPITLSYHALDGSALTGNDLRRVAWLDDDELLPHVITLAETSPILVRVQFGQPVPAEDRKSLATRCQQIIAEDLLQARSETAVTQPR